VLAESDSSLYKHQPYTITEAMLRISRTTLTRQVYQFGLPSGLPTLTTHTPHAGPTPMPHVYILSLLHTLGVQRVNHALYVNRLCVGLNDVYIVISESVQALCNSPMSDTLNVLQSLCRLVWSHVLSVISTGEVRYIELLLSTGKVLW
jgi:hypothetical protein